MYNVQVNENNFYTGSYATVGTVKNGVNVSKLPPSENSLCYKLVDVEVPEEKQVPILEYTKTVESETEFDTYYTMTVINEDVEETESDTTGDETETPVTEESTETTISITEEEYNELSDEEKERVTITQVPKMVTIVLLKDEYDALSDEEKDGFIAAYRVDENGELVLETIQVTKIVKDWEFSQERYDELEAERVQKEKEQEEAQEYQESISNEALKAENQMLREEVAALKDENAALNDEVVNTQLALVEVYEMMLQ